MRYRIVIEIEAPKEVSRAKINEIAQRAMDETVTKLCNPVFLSTEVIADKQRTILREVDEPSAERRRQDELEVKLQKAMSGEPQS